MLNIFKIVPIFIALSMLPAQAQTTASLTPAAKSPARVKHKTHIAQPDPLDAEIQGIDRSAATMDAEQALYRTAQNFRIFIVDPKHITTLLQGLQQGETVSLPSPANGRPVRVVKNAPAMSLGNAYVAISLAKLDLARYEILQPTYEQLYKVFHGGTFVQARLHGNRKIRFQGVLKQYARSHNWGSVAQRMGISIEPLRYDMQSTAVALIDRQLTPASLTTRRQSAEKARTDIPDAL